MSLQGVRSAKEEFDEITLSRARHYKTPGTSFTAKEEFEDLVLFCVKTIIVGMVAADCDECNILRGSFYMQLVMICLKKTLFIMKTGNLCMIASDIFL